MKISIVKHAAMLLFAVVIESLSSWQYNLDDAKQIAKKTQASIAQLFRIRLVHSQHQAS